MAGTIAENWAFVLFAYLLGFFIWAAASAHDYISSTWRTLKTTRRNGLWHLGFLLLPMSYMLAYIYLQAKAQEYTEMSAGIVALLFAWIDFFRTVVGLWQLHILRQWLVSSIRSLESLGYTATENEESKKLQEEMVRMTTAEWFSWAHAVADGVKVNESIVENRFTEGDVKCYLRLRFLMLETAEGGKRRIVPRMIIRILNCCCAFFYLPQFLWCISVSGSKAYTSPKSLVHLEPHQPEEVWMRWACVLISQIFPEWLEDMKGSVLAMDGRSDADFSTSRAKFAMEVLLSAALHTQRSPQSGPVSEQQEHGARSGGAECNYGNQSSHSFLKFDKWDKYTKLCQGAFSKQEFLRVACSTGDGLPFGIPHAESEKKKGESSLYSYSKLATKLERSRESFPVEGFEKLEGFDPSALEWLAIFLSVPNWRTEETSNRGIGSVESGCSASGVVATDEDSSGESTRTTETASGFSVSEVVGTDECSPEESAGTSFALQNLSSQLGVGTNLDGETGIGSLGIGSFPLIQSSWKRCLWRNRNIMEASLHVDNFLALCVGGQYGFMLEKESETRKRLFQAAQAVDPNLDEAEYGPPSFRTLPTTWDENALVENERLMYQFACIRPEFAFLEQGMTFLGCSMECLRSSLARWVARNPSIQDQAWTTTLVQSDTSSTQTTPFKFQTSKSFASCVPNLLDTERFEKRYVQMRLIWELQNYFHHLLPAEGVSPDRAEAIILCILSFPALQVAVESGNVKQISEAESVANVEGGWAISIGPETPSTSATEEVHLAVRVPCAPQHVTVQIMLQRTDGDDGVRASAAVGTDSSRREISFAWELWRNAFSARLETVRQWQKKHDLPRLDLVRTTTGIGEGIGRACTERTGTGEDMDVWLGWLPHRVSMCMFELESTGFILRRKKEEYAVPHEFLADEVHHTGILKETQVCVPYKRASLSELEHASAIARELLDKIAKCGSELGRIVKITGEDILQKADEIAKKNSKENDELVANLYEVVGVHMSSITVLEKVVEFLLRGKSIVAKTRRAVEMIECFCAFAGVTKTDTQFGCASLRFENEHVAQDVLRLMESMLSKDEGGSIVVRSAARIFTSFENFGTAEHREKLSAALGASVLRCSSSEDHQEIPGLKAILGSIISSSRTGVDTLPFLLVSKFVETRDENLDWTGLAVKLLLGSNVPRSVPLAITVRNVAFQESRGRTEQGYTLNFLAMLFRRGTTGVENAVRAVELYERAIREGNDTDAMVSLADLLTDGAADVEVNAPRAVELLQRCAHSSVHSRAMNTLGLLLENGRPYVVPDAAQAVQAYSSAIRADDDWPSKNNLAVLLTYDAIGVPRDIPRAVQLYEELLETEAAKRVAGTAANNLGVLLQLGAENVPVNCARAAQLYMRASENGDHSAGLYNLAVLVKRGFDGVPADANAASDLYMRAVGAGGPVCSDNFGEYLSSNNSYQSEGGMSADALRYTAAIERDDDVRAMNNLAVLLQNGAEGVAADPPRAKRLYARASWEGAHVGAMENLARLLETGADGVPADAQCAEEIRARAREFLS